MAQTHSICDDNNAFLSHAVDNIHLIVAFAMAGRFGITAVYSIVTRKLLINVDDFSVTIVHCIYSCYLFCSIYEVHTAEMFPTNIRNSALGTSSTSSHVGSIMAPYVVDFLVCYNFNGSRQIIGPFLRAIDIVFFAFDYRDVWLGLFRQLFVGC